MTTDEQIINAMLLQDEEGNDAKLNIDKIVSFVEFHYSKPFPRFREQLLYMASEYLRIPEMFFIADGELAEMLSKKCKGDKYEFIYFPQMAMTITNIAWHSDLIREFLFDLNHPKLRGTDFNDMAYQGIQRGIVGFVSSVSNNMQINEEYLCSQDKEYLARFIKNINK